MISRSFAPSAMVAMLLFLLLEPWGCDREENHLYDWTLSECGGCSTSEEKLVCNNGIDDDEDGLTDCEDPDCKGIGCCGLTGMAEDSDGLCSDGCDNDQNGYTDCKDYSCSKNAKVMVCKSAEKVDEDTPERCSDGVDNDWDGQFDCNDWDCSQSELVTFCEGNDFTCSDGIDNDGNGYVDCKDFSCSKNKKVTVCR